MLLPLLRSTAAAAASARQLWGDVSGGAVAAAAAASRTTALLPQWLAGSDCSGCSCSFSAISLDASAKDAAAAAQLPPPPSKQPSLRSLKAKANLEYSRQRAAWRRQLGALRRKWLEEHQAAQHAREEVQRRDAWERQQLAALHSSQKQRDKGEGQLLRDIRDAERQVEAVGVLWLARGGWRTEAAMVLSS
jgi:hypothetical protein